MTKLEQLVMKRAALLKEIKSMQPPADLLYCRQHPSQEELENLSIEQLSENCIERAYRLAQEERYSHDEECGGYPNVSYDRVFECMIPEACASCAEIRRLKKLRAPLKRELGNVNSQITQIGQRLAKNG